MRVSNKEIALALDVVDVDDMVVVKRGEVVKGGKASCQVPTSDM